MNKKGTIFDEGIWILKIVLFLILIGIVVTFVLTTSGIDVGAMLSSGWSHIWGWENGTVSGGFP
jgi:hypothetical protein